jgi:SAM-dependent methyltransferase
MQRLTEQGYWDAVNAGGHGAPPPVAEKMTWPHRLGRRLFGDGWVLTRWTFAEYDFWRQILPRHVQRDPACRVIEVGSAPGLQLVEFHKHFGYEPHGVEYTPSGVRSNRQTFEQYGFNPDHVVEGDFFSEQFQGPRREAFDAVLSRGFMEHFTDMDKVVESHVRLLKPGGLLITSIPNLSGINRYMVRRFMPELLPIHNLSLMNLPVYRKLFERPDLEPLACGYQGGVNLLMGAFDENRVPPLLLTLLRRAQLLMNFLQFFTGPLNTRWSSPNLMFIGRKR